MGKDHIIITLPDGSEKQWPRGTTPADVAKDIGPRLAKAAVAATVNGETTDLTRPMIDDATLSILTADSPEGLAVLRHSAAHLMAQAIKRLFPDAKFAIGPVVDERFYYDMRVAKPLTVEDFEAIEAEMGRIVKENLRIEREEVSKSSADAFFRKAEEPFKLEILSDLEDGDISVYKQGEFVDLCRGPHVPSTGYIKAFKLLSVAGAYWRGDSDNEQLQRVYGTAFPDRTQLDEYVQRMEEAAKRDHRRLGPALGLFTFHDEAPGFAFWQPKGQVLYRTLEDFSRQVQQPRGYEEVATPWILRSKLWEQSGHWGHYKENMFLIESEGEMLAAKPMNCPNHCLMYKEQTRSYRDLPWRVAEYGPLARFEMSGTLHGLLRVRGLHQDDAHIFVTEDQIEAEIGEVLEIVDEIYGAFGMSYEIELSTRPDEFMGDAATWDRAEAALAQALEKAGRAYTINEGDGAFYGPKLDFQLTDAIGRVWQCATVQLDYQFPENFDLTYVDRDGQLKRPVMIHRAILGSMERFIGILTEHFAGAFPTWLAPVQVKVLPISDNHLDYARDVVKQLGMHEVRAEVDARNEKIGYKIREAQVQKIPYMLIVGDKEIAEGTVSVRSRTEGDVGAKTVDAFTKAIVADIEAKHVTPALSS